jgi:hypothetical protein
MPRLLILAGLAVFVIGAAAGFKDWVKLATAGRVCVMVLGGLLIASGFWLYFRERSEGSAKSASAPLPDASKIGVQIFRPEQNELVGELVDASGSFQKGAIPVGYELRVLRGYPRQGGVLPSGTLRIEESTGRWSVADFGVGGEGSKTPPERRSLEIWLVGQSGKAALQCWSDAHQVHAKAMYRIKELTGKYGQWLDPIRALPKDMILCAKVDLLRK